MNKFIVTILIITCSVTAGVAQNLLVGPGILFKAGLNAGDIPTGQKTTANVNFVPDINATAKFMFTKESAVGLLFDLGYNSVSYRMRPENETVANDNNTFVSKVGHLVLAPSLFLSGFTLGAGIGFPLSTSTVNVAGNTDVSDPSLSNYSSPYVEIRMGGMIEAMKNESGVLNIVIQAGYGVTGLAQSSNGAVPFNPRPVTFGIGVNYLFGLIGRP
jgi:hypothetical protein